MDIKAEDFFSTIEEICTGILAEKALKRASTIYDAISDLEQANGDIASPDSKSFRHGLYGKQKSNLQKLLK